MKILFLDIDGVLNSAATISRNHFNPDYLAESKSHVHRYGSCTCWPDSKLVSRLNDILVRTDAEVVVSSTWRLDGRQKIAAACRDFGLCKSIKGITPRMNSYRGEEIKWWLEFCPYNSDIHSAVILDDDSDMGEMSPLLVQTSHSHGIQLGHVIAATEILESPISWRERINQI